MSWITPEVIAIVTVGVGLADLMLRALNRIDKLDDRIDKLDGRLSAVEEEQARVVGLLEGLGFTGRATPPPPAA